MCKKMFTSMGLEFSGKRPTFLDFVRKTAGFLGVASYAQSRIYRSHLISDSGHFNDGLTEK